MNECFRHNSAINLYDYYRNYFLASDLTVDAPSLEVRDRHTGKYTREKEKYGECARGKGHTCTEWGRKHRQKC